MLRSKQEKGKGKREEVFTPSVLKGKRRVIESRDLWIDYFSDVLGCLLGDGAMEKGLGQTDQIVARAAHIADEALRETEQRFPGL